MHSFDEIFGPGEFDNENQTFEREFMGVRVGGRPRNPLSFEALIEHAKRRKRIDYDLHPGSNSKDIELYSGDMTIEIENFSDGSSVLNINIDDSKDIGEMEAYLRGSIDDWIGEIFRREQNVYSAATFFVHQRLSNRLSEEELTGTELLEKELEYSGEELKDFHEGYREGPPHDLALILAARLELMPHEIEKDKSDLSGKAPLSDELEDSSYISRNDFYQRMYLTSVIEEADQAYEIGDGLRRKWLDYVDSGFGQAKCK